MAALFSHGNAMSTLVGQLIDQATDGSQAGDNWTLYMEICDVINETDDGPKDAVRAFRKKLSQNVGKNYNSVLYCLTCIESCVKNCGRRFHIQVANKDFLHDLVKIIGPKNGPPQTVQEKILSMIQTWADAFRGIPELKEVEKVYLELKQKGIEFPSAGPENLAPIHTPARSVPEREPAPLHDRGGSIRGKKYAELVNESDEEPTAPSGGYPPAGLCPVGQVVSSRDPISPDQTTKLRRELDVVQGNIHVMSEMLTELSPANVDSSDLELLQELNRTCRQMQSRIVELLNGSATEEITNDLLRVNDDLNNVFLRYERFERYRTGQSGQASTPQNSHIPSQDQPPVASNPSVGNLIDLSDDPVPTTQSATSQMAGLSLGNKATTNTVAAAAPQPHTDDFAVFAQSRQPPDQNKQPFHGTNLAPHHDDTNSVGRADSQKQTMSDDETLKLQDKETDYDEMEQWLATHGNGALGGQPQESITGSEFDRFLSERATASESVPTISAQTGQQAARTTRTLQKTDQDENPLFAL